MPDVHLIEELQRSELDADLASRAAKRISELEARCGGYEGELRLSLTKVIALSCFIVLLVFLFKGDPDVFDVFRQYVMTSL